MSIMLTDKGKASFLEGEGVAILKMVLQESDDEELIDIVFEMITSLILDGKWVFSHHNLNNHGFSELKESCPL